MQWLLGKDGTGCSSWDTSVHPRTLSHLRDELANKNGKCPTRLSIDTIFFPALVSFQMECKFTDHFGLPESASHRKEMIQQNYWI